MDRERGGKGVGEGDGEREIDKDWKIDRQRAQLTVKTILSPKPFFQLFGPCSHVNFGLTLLQYTHTWVGKLKIVILRIKAYIFYMFYRASFCLHQWWPIYQLHLFSLPLTVLALRLFSSFLSLLWAFSNSALCKLGFAISIIIVRHYFHFWVGDVYFFFLLLFCVF